MQPQALMKIAKGQNKLFSKCITFDALLEYFLLLNTESVRYVIDLLFQVQLSPDHPMSNKI